MKMGMMTWIMIAIGIWLVADVVFCLALCAAAHGPMPSPSHGFAELGNPSTTSGSAAVVGEGHKEPSLLLKKVA